MKLNNLLHLLLFSSVISTFSLAEPLKSSNVTWYTPELLSVTMSICNDKVELKCPTSEPDRDNRMFFCGFNCSQGTVYHCKEDTYHGILEFCAKPEICDKGQMHSVYFDSEHQRVVIQKSSCPEGLFQPFEEDCYIACTQYHHVDESFLPDLGIVVLYHGNSTNPGVGYCDVDNGYVNIDYNMYINLTLYEVSVCDKKENFQIKCATGQRLLPDSRCVPVCKQGYVVNKKDFFKCSLHSSTDTVITQTSTQEPDVSTSSGISSSKRITNSIKGSTTPPQQGAILNTAIAVGISVLGVIIVVIIVALNIYCIVKLCQKKGKKSKGSEKKIKCKNFYKECKLLHVKGDQDVNIYIKDGAETWKFEETLPGESGEENSSLVEPGHPDAEAMGPETVEQRLMELKSASFSSDKGADSDETETGETEVKKVVE